MSLLHCNGCYLGKTTVYGCTVTTDIVGSSSSKLMLYLKLLYSYLSHVRQ